VQTDKTQKATNRTFVLSGVNPGSVILHIQDATSSDCYSRFITHKMPFLSPS